MYGYWVVPLLHLSNILQEEAEKKEKEQELADARAAAAAAVAAAANKVRYVARKSAVW